MRIYLKKLLDLCLSKCETFIKEGYWLKCEGRHLVASSLNHFRLSFNELWWMLVIERLISLW